DCRVAALDVQLHFCEAYVAEVRDHVHDRLCRGAALDSARLSDRARAHSRIFKHAVCAVNRATAPEMQHFARKLFLLARQCGAAGLDSESRDLFLLAKAASSADRAAKLDFRIYEMAARVLGWPLVGRIACATDKLRK